MAYNTFSTLQDRSWVDGLIMDLWLMLLWQGGENMHLRYIPMDYLHPDYTPPSQQEIKKFRSTFNLPLDGACPLEPIIGFTMSGSQENDGVRKGGNHYFAVVIFPQEKMIHTLGRDYSHDDIVLDASLDTWKGVQIWKNVARLHGWLPTTMDVREVNWEQNGFDCGLITCHVIEWIGTHRFQTIPSSGVWKKPTIPCMHHHRIRVANGLQHIVEKSLRTFQSDLAGGTDFDAVFDCQGSEELIQPVREEFMRNPGGRLRVVVKSNQAAMKKCGRCLEEAQCRQAVDKVKPITSGARKKPRGPSLHPVDEPQDENQEEISDSSSSSDENGNPVRANQHHHVGDFREANMGRFPRPEPITQLPPLAEKWRYWLKPDLKYDDYQTGPTFEELESNPEPIEMLMSISLAYMVKQVILNPWNTFKDYGYRIQPDFLQMLEPPDPTEHLEAGLSRTGQPIEFTDLKIMGAEEMILAADEAGSNDMFVTGILKSSVPWEAEQFIHIDLMRDGVQPEAVDQSCDIDSLIWTTRRPRFKQSLMVLTIPLIRRKAPIWKNNQINVDILFPPSEEDRSSGGPRSEWVSKPFRLSRIPHLLFGVQGDHTNLYMFFPRMIHRHPHRRFWANHIPAQVQNLLWDRVVIPAMMQSSPEMNRIYVGLDRTHIQFKNKITEARVRMPPRYPFSETLLDDLLDEISLIVSSHL